MYQKVVILEKGEIFFLDGKFFLIREGRVISRAILPNGRVISHENCFREGELVGNFFGFLENQLLDSRLLVPEIEIQIEVLENETVLEEISLTSRDIAQYKYLEIMIIQLIKTSLIKSLHLLYDSKRYILAVLKLHANEKGVILKNEVKYDNFNISRSQFYLLYSNLKKEEFIVEDRQFVKLNIKKVDKFLKEYIDD